MEVRNNNISPYHQHQQQASYANDMAAAAAAAAAHFLPRTMPPPIPTIPPGLQALYDSCLKIYPDQPNPLQVTAVVKFWLGGPDPLDYISMYYNKGDDENGVPPHWHYISFGLSDLHGDGRVHQITDAQTPSGFGFELTFRLKKEADETSPPTWPAAVMQALAKYVFQTGNILCSGDHVSWHCPLDNSESRIQHMLMTEDTQLGTTSTMFGPVTFIQIVGVCLEELQAAQQWNGPGIIDLMRSVSGVGGSFLITDMRRGETIFEMDPEFREAVDDGIATQGSNLSGVSARCSYQIKKKDNDNEETNEDGHRPRRENADEDNDEDEPRKQDKPQNRGGVKSPMEHIDSRATSRHSSMSVSHDQGTSRMSFASETGTNEPAELIQTKYLDGIHLNLNYEAGILLPLALRGRLKHGRHFTYKNIQGDLAITFVTEAVAGSFVTREQPYAKHGPWLQILIPQEYIELMLAELEDVEELEQDTLPLTYEWKKMNLAITLQPEE